MASFGLQNSQCITRGNKQVTSGLPSTTGRLQALNCKASPKQQVTPMLNTDTDLVQQFMISYWVTKTRWGRQSV